MTPEVKELMRKLSVLLARVSASTRRGGIINQIVSNGNTISYNGQINSQMVEEYSTELSYSRRNTTTVINESLPFSWQMARPQLNSGTVIIAGTAGEIEGGNFNELWQEVYNLYQSRDNIILEADQII